MISYFNTVKGNDSKHCHPINSQGLIEILKDPELKLRADKILQLISEGKDAEAKEEKMKLPVVVLGQLYDEGQARSKNGGKSTGLLMIDYDDCKTIEEAQQFMNDIKAKWLGDLYLQELIVAAHFSPRMHGVHIWYRWIDGCSSYKECNERMSKLLGKPNYDEGCKDNSRCSFLVPYDYFKIENFAAIDDNAVYAKLQDEQEKKDCVSIKPSDAFRTATSATPVASDSAAAHDWPAEYEGIPYDQLVKELTLECASKSMLNADGSVSEGARDNTFFKVACLLRYACDNNAEWVASLAPQWALQLNDEQPGRVNELCHNACKRDLSFSIPKTLQKIVDKYNKVNTDASSNSINEKQKQCLKALDDAENQVSKFHKVPSALPPIFQECCDSVKPEWKPAVILSLLTALGTLCSKVRGVYVFDEIHSPSFQTVIEAPMGAGKSKMSAITELVMEPITILDEIGNNEINLYNAERVRANNSKQLAEKPNPIVRGLIGRFTEAGFNDVIDTAHGLHVWQGVAEIDLLAPVWKEFSAILRLAYGNERYGRTIQSPNQKRRNDPLYFNTFLCGTPSAVNRAFSNPEDGTVSRAMFFKLMGETPDAPVNRLTETKKKKIRKLCQRLHTLYCVGEDGEVVPEVFFKMDSITRFLMKWCDKKYMESVKYANPAIDRFRRRDASHAFNAALVAVAIYNAAGIKIGDKERRIIRNFAEWVAEYTLMTHLYKYADQFNAIHEKENSTRPLHHEAFLDKLPDTFVLAEAYQAYPKMQESTVRKNLSQLCKFGQLVSVSRGVYAKI